MNETPQIGYWHLWTDGQGISHHTRCTIEKFELSSIQPGAAPQWLGNKTDAHVSILMTVLPPGWVGEWHENPKPQWIVPLNGRWFVEAMDGSRVEMGTGELSFGQDQNCRTIENKRGHRSGTVGDVPAVLMLVQFDEAATDVCPFR